MSSESQIIATHTSSAGIGQGRAPERQPDSHGFHAALSRLMNQLELRYCLLRSPGPELGDSPAGVELTLHPEDHGLLPLLIENLRKEGYLPIQRVPLAANDCRYDFAGSENANTRFFSLTIRQVFPLGHLMARDGGIFARRQKQGNFWVLGDADEFCYLFSKINLEGEITESEHIRLKQLAKILGPSVVGTIAAGLFGGGLQQEVMAASVDGDWKKVQQRLRKQSVLANFRSAPIEWFKYWLLQFRCTLQRWLHPDGMFIVILGPDGAGKSTLTKKILELFGPLFERHRVFQWRPMVLKPRDRYQYVPWFNPPHTEPPHGPVESILRIFAVLCDYWVGYPAVIRPLLTRAGLIIYDRDLHDLLVDRLRYRYGGPDWFPRLAIRLCPEPETVFLTMDADPDVILNRKNEVAPDELRRQRRAYLELAASLPNSTVVRTDKSIEASASAAIGAVLTYMAGRFERNQPRPATLAEKQTKESEQTVLDERYLPSMYTLARRLLEACDGWKSWALKGCMAIADQGFISASNFVLSVLLARSLGAEQYGAYALAFSTFVLLSLIHQALVLEPMSVFGPSLYRKALRRYLGLLLWLQMGMGAIFVIGGTSFGVLSSLLKEPRYLTLAVVGMAFASPCVLLLWFARRAFYLQLLPGRALIGAITYSAVFWAGIWALFHGKAVSPFSAFLVMGTGALLTSILLLIRLWSTAGVKATAGALALREVCQQHWRYGRWALVSGLFIWIPWNIFYSVVARSSGLAEAGTLRALLNLALPITSAYAPLSMLFLSHAAHLGHEEGWEPLKALAFRIAGLFALGSGAYWVVVCFFQSQVIHFLYAGQYTRVVTLVPLVAISSILQGAAMGPTIAIRATRSPATVSLLYFGASLIALVVGIPACLAWGFRGAILAILLSSITTFVVGFQMLRSRKLQDRALAPGTEQIAPESVSISS
jgi:O-antigen/teichoic acid export membrane protein/thymidylate kinase